MKRSGIWQVVMGLVLVISAQAASASQCPNWNDEAGRQGRKSCGQIEKAAGSAKRMRKTSNAGGICAALHGALGKPLGIGFVAGSLPGGEPLPAERKAEHDRPVGGHFNAVFTAEVSPEQAEELRRRLSEARGVTGIRFDKLHIKHVSFQRGSDARVLVTLVAHMDSDNANRDMVGALHHLVRDVVGGTLVQALAKGSLDQGCPAS